MIVSLAVPQCLRRKHLQRGHAYGRVASHTSTFYVYTQPGRYLQTVRELAIMRQVAVVTDSVSCIPPDMLAQYEIEIVPIRLMVQGRVYRDSVDITSSQAYEAFLQDPEAFSTSPSSPGHYLEAYRRASALARNVLCVTLSSRLSTGHEMASVARGQAAVEFPEATVEVLDSRNVTAAEGFVALSAAREAAAGKGLAEVVSAAERVRDRVAFLFLLDTIRYVYRTGRIPRLASKIGGRLNVKPMLTSSDGLVRFKGVARSREQGVNRLLKMLRDEAGRGPVHVGVMHAYAPEEAQDLSERIAAEFDCVELWVTEFSPVMGYATGTGTLGFAFYPD